MATTPLGVNGKCLNIALMFIVLSLIHVNVNVGEKVFDLSNYGGVSGGVADNKEALSKAWADACTWKGQDQAVLLIQDQTYLTSPIKLVGPCGGPVKFLNKGVLKAPVDIEQTFTGVWLDFQYVNGLTIDEFGLFDGQGHYNGTTPPDANPGGFVLFGLGLSKNSTIQNLNVKNSPFTHLALFGCDNITISNVNVTSPGLKPNTDGIKIGKTNNVNILQSNVASGDDCVAILQGSTNINISNFFCSPGHGISIGGIGYANEQPVSNVSVQHAHLRDTLTGLNIKTAATEFPGAVSNVFYQDVFLENTYNPIIINQDYCPQHNCPPGNSHVKVSNVQYNNIWGTSRTDNAVTFNCSSVYACEDIQLNNINLSGMDGKAARSTCTNVHGRASGIQNPPSCL